MCGIPPYDCVRFHIQDRDGKCRFDWSRVPNTHISIQPNWSGRRGKWSENRQRKSVPAATGRQLRIARYNYASRRVFKRPWQAELTVNPRNVLWAVRKRQSL